MEKMNPGMDSSDPDILWLGQNSSLLSATPRCHRLKLTQFYDFHYDAHWYEGNLTLWQMWYVRHRRLFDLD